MYCINELGAFLSAEKNMIKTTSYKGTGKFNLLANAFTLNIVEVIILTNKHKYKADAMYMFL